jgi:PAS domain S-box-containing protein
MIVDGASHTTPTDELTQLRSRITELEQQLCAAESASDLRVFKAVVDNAPDAVGLAGLDGVVFYANTAHQTISGYGRDLIGMSFYTLYPEELHATVAAAGQKVLERGFWQGMLTWKHKDGHMIPIQVTLFLIHDEQGTPKGFTSIVRDITEQQQAENERLILQEQVIAAQQAALRELSTPLIPIAENVVAMPLIGSLDSARAQQVIETLLSGVASAHATTAIVDITGVPVVDTQVANALLRAAQAVRLLGAHVILTGIRPEVAQTLVGLGLDLSGIVTRSTLQSGIAFALERTAASR